MRWSKEPVMVFVETRYEHVVLDDSGVPRIADTTIKVVELVMPHLAYGWSPDELHFQYPHLSLGQIYSALAYYWDHQAALDQDMARREALGDEIERTTPEPPLRRRLREQGRD